MSIKIYNGFKFRTNDIREVFSLVQHFRGVLSPLINAKVASFLATQAVRDMDRWCSNTEIKVWDTSRDFAEHLAKYRPRFPEEVKEELLAVALPFLQETALKEATKKVSEAPDFLSTAWDELQSRQKNVKMTKERDPLVDFDFNIAILPISSSILGIYYTEQRDFEELWMSHELVEAYGYWDNTDEEEDVSEEEWTQREIDWEEALTVNGEHVAPSFAGLGADFVPLYLPYPEIEDVLSRVPAFDKRVERTAYERVHDRKYMELFREAGEPKDRFFSLAFDVRDWLESPEGQGALLEEQARVEKLMVPVVTGEHLLGTAFEKRILRI